MIEIIGYAVIGFMIAEGFQPIQWIKGIFIEYFEEVIRVSFKRRNFQFKYKHLLYCSKCITFWGTLIYTQNILIAAIASILAYMIQFIINKMDANWEV